MALSLNNIDRRKYSLAGWTKDEDILLVRLLDSAACRHRLSRMPYLMSALRSSCVSIRDVLRKPVTIHSLIKSLSFILKKYMRFKAFINQHGVVYDVRSNRVHVTRNYWKFLDRRNETMLERNLRARGEPMYTLLRNIFTCGRCATISSEYLAVHGGESVDDGDISNPSTPTSV